MSDYNFISALVLLFLIIDPFGNIPIFATTLKDTPAEKRWKVIIREHVIAFGLLLGFMLVGQSLLNAMGLSVSSLQIGGAVVLFLIAIRMIFPPPDDGDDGIEGYEPLIVPLAIPAVAGPSSLATVMLLVNQQPDKLFSWIGALSLAILASMVILVSADKLQKRLGFRFVVAMEKLMGLILVALSVEMLVRGVKTVVA